MSKKLKVFTLKMSKWLRGNSVNMRKAGGLSRLYDTETKTYCCLGMFGRQCGVSVNRLRGASYPSEVHNRDKAGDFSLLLTDNGDDLALTMEAAGINDNPATTDKQKIARLRPIFRKLGYRIEVVL